MHQQTRSWLQGREPELAGRLERCWEFAFNEWLPAVNENMGSFNSFPHLRNLEMYLDEILFAKHPDVPDKQVIEVLGMTPSEVYVMLCSILFHDLGKSYKGGHSHACESRITLAKYYRTLGLDSEEIALCIGRICHFHDPEKSKDMSAEVIGGTGTKEKTWPLQLRDVTITEYGVIREKLLGALLVLVDHLDGTFSRVLPHYVRTEDFGAIGKFRNQIPGIRVDPSARMAVTVIKPLVLTKELKKEESENVTLCLNTKSPEVNTLNIKADVRITFQGDKQLPPDDTKYPKSSLDISFIFKGSINIFIEPDVIKEQVKLIENELNNLNNNILCHHYHNPLKDLLEYIELIRKVTNGTDDAGGGSIMGTQVFRLSPLAEGKCSTPWSIPSLLIAANMAFLDGNRPSSSQSQLFLHATIAGNTRENADALKRISGPLRAYGIPVHAWLLECDEHLYTWFGAETYEPLLSDDFLKRLAQAMWNKSTKVFGRGASTYEGLASDLREENVERIRMGVRRLSILTRTPENEEKIRALQDGWEWKTKSLRLCELMDKIIALKKPTILDPADEKGKNNA